MEFCGALLYDTEGANFHSLPTVRGWTKYILRTQKFPFFSFKTESSQWNFKRSYIFQFFLYNTAVTIPGCSKSPHYYDIIIDLMHMSSYNRLASWWVYCNKTKLYYIILTCNIFFSVLNSVIGVIDSPVVLDYWDS